jgi:hypothetical protein
MSVTKGFVPHLGHHVVLSDREKMRVKDGRVFHRIARDHPLHSGAPLPVPPSSFDWTKGGQIVLPIDGNNEYGNCFYVAPTKAIRTAVGQYSSVSFDVNKLIARYLQVSGGDNGLSDDQIFPEWKRGLIGPDGAYKLLDYAIIDPSNAGNSKLGVWAFPTLWTTSMPSTWLNEAAPGVIWDRDGGHSVGGHAMFLSGADDQKRFQTETWGIQKPAIRVTQAGMLANDPELIVCFVPEWFHPVTRQSPAGLSWEQSRELWIQMGGKDVGPDPVAPAPIPTPTPTPTPVPTPTPAPVPTPSGPQFGVSYPVTIKYPGGLFGSMATIKGAMVLSPPTPGFKLTPDELQKAIADVFALLASNTGMSVRTAIFRVVADIYAGQYGPALADAIAGLPALMAFVEQVVAIVGQFNSLKAAAAVSGPMTPSTSWWSDHGQALVAKLLEDLLAGLLGG